LGTTLASFGPNAISTDAIRVLALDPAITATSIETALSKFDARWVSSMNWNTTESPIGTSASFIQAGGAAIQSINTQAATFSTAIVKPLPTGGVAGITFDTVYQISNSPIARLNPSYTPTLQFNFEQPLLQGFGVEINQLRAQHPGGILTGDQFPGVSTPLNEGILISRLRFDQTRANFERLVQALAFNVEWAYWNLYYAYWDLYSNEAGLRQAYEAWKINNEKYKAGRLSLADFAQTRGQYELFRGNRIESLGRLLEAERILRGYLGLPMEDCTRLVPSDTPTLAPYQPDWCTAQAEALALLPSLVIAREELKVRQLDLINQRNLLLPDLRFTSTYGITGIGSQLAGGADSALKSLASDHFNNWSAGLNLTVPIGFREAHANVRLARLNLARSYYVLRDGEYRANRFLVQQYRWIQQSYAAIEARRSQREAFADQLRARFQEYVAGRGTLDILLEAQRFWAQALASEYQAIADYNNALASFEYAKGTILQHDNIYIAEGPLPKCAQVRAVEHERERTKALVLLERAVPVAHEPVGGDKGGPILPALPAGSAPSLPALFEKAPPLPEGIDTAPAPRPVVPDKPQGAAPSGQATITSTSGLTAPAAPAAPAARPPVQAGTPLPSPATQSGSAPPPLPSPATLSNPGTAPAAPKPEGDRPPSPTPPASQPDTLPQP
jgi:outer membrane protein TolC